MKTSYPPTSISPSVNRRGFSLIVTVTMLILLSLIAVGLLSLSATTVRSSQNSVAKAKARANARLALNIAIANLQKHAGPDTRVTARAEVVDDSVANPYLTGVWESWPLDPNAGISSSDYSQSSKEDKLLSWLVSGAPTDGSVTHSFVESSLQDEVTLWGEGSLGTSVLDREKVRASRVSIGEDEGAYAWAVLDEGVKARVNTFTDEQSNDFSDQVAQLGSGVRPAVETIQGLEGFSADSFEVNSDESELWKKSVSFQNFELAAEQAGGTQNDTVKSLLHDITLFSQGLLTDTARGGLRTDFNLFASHETIPPLYSHEEEGLIQLADRGVYETLLNLPTSGLSSSPHWNSLFEFARLHEDGLRKENGVPLVAAQVPDGDWIAGLESTGRRGTTFELNRETPDQLVLMPTIAKVQMIFSLVGRDLYLQPSFPAGSAPANASGSANLHNPQADYFKGTNYSYDLQLLYTPVVVLHNPYSVALEFEELGVQFHHIPFALKIFRNGEAQSSDFVPFETMFADNETGGLSKVFGMNLFDEDEDSGEVGSSTLSLLPGEVVLFSPYLDPSLTYQDNFGGNRQNWDIYVQDNKTANLNAIPGWRGNGIGYSCDWLAGAFDISPMPSNGRWRSCYGLSVNDDIHAEFAPYSTASSENKFFVTLSGKPAGSSQTKVVNAIEIDYGSGENLRGIMLGSGSGSLRYPADGAIQGREFIDWSGSSLADMENVRPIAVLSLQAKTTHGAIDFGSDSQIDGRVAAKPWSFAHGSIAASTADLTVEHPSAHSHEIDLQPLTFGGGTDDLVELNGKRGYFITGNSSTNGQQFGVKYELPVVPLQSLSTLNGANPGGASTQLPRFASPIGNSWAHPLLDSDSFEQPAARGYQMYDHSYLLNSAFYDRFYFSGLGSQTGPFGNGHTASRTALDFIESGSLRDQRLALYQPDGRQAEEMEALVNDPEGHEKIAAWQIMNGAFNINSTSVKAWKAMLQSVHAPNAQVNLISEDPASTSSSLGDLAGANSGETRMSRFRLPLSHSSAQGGIEELAYWLGPRDYTEQEMELLAAQIVEQVKLRGPFLSLGEFVNRQLGNGELAQKGALQAAIDEAGINLNAESDAGAGYEIDSDRLGSYGYANPEAATGSSSQGAPGYLTQADVLSALGNAATARSDTFTIRGYGETKDKAGRTLASAVCEAVVQRFPEWIDPRDAVEVRPSDLTSEENIKFGRRFRVVSFRWLGEGEV